MRPLPMTITFFIALWLEDVLKNAEIAAKFFRNNACLRGWADDSFEAVQWKREAMFPVTHNSMNGRGKISEGLETNGQCPFLAQLCSQGKSIFLTKNQKKEKKNMHYDTWLESDLQQPTGTVIKMQCFCDLIQRYLAGPRSFRPIASTQRAPCMTKQTFVY